MLSYRYDEQRWFSMFFVQEKFDLVLRVNKQISMLNIQRFLFFQRLLREGEKSQIRLVSITYLTFIRMTRKQSRFD